MTEEITIGVFETKSFPNDVIFDVDIVNLSFLGAIKILHK